MLLLIEGGRVIDPDNIDDIMDIYISDGKITEIIAHGLTSSKYPESIRRDPETKRIDASGKIVAPGFIDMHVHLREPGQEHKETIETGCLAAAHGGFTGVCAMPNTDPANDCRQVTEFILEKARAAQTARVYPVAAVSQGLRGKRLCDFKDLKAAGAVAVSDDGHPVMSSLLMRQALEYADSIGLLVISHSEDIHLAARGVMNEGNIATKLGLSGIPNAAESIMVLRDIELSELTKSPVHIAHVSTRQSVRAIRDAKQRGLPVTAETAPHYFTLTDASVEMYNTHAKMNPPLRSARDREAVRQGLADGTIDVIATDHAPHAFMEKNVEFNSAPNGIIGLETSIPISLTLVEEKVITLAQLIEKMSKNPARILGLETGISIGKAADITIIDPDRHYQIDAGKFQSLSRNTPFDGWRVKGRAVGTVVGGKIVYIDSDIDNL